MVLLEKRRKDLESGTLKTLKAEVATAARSSKTPDAKRKVLFFFNFKKWKFVFKNK